jgi:hypothetical protein
MDKETENFLKSLYYKKENINKTFKELYDLGKAHGKKLTQKQVSDFLKSQEINQVYKQDKRPEKFSSIVADGIRHEYQMDIMVYDRYEYNKYKYILVIVDIYSRYAEARAMTNRENKTILNNMINIFKQIGKPKIISCDNEFNTNEFKTYCEKNNIQVNFSIPNDIQKNSIVERLNRTLAGFIKKLRYLKIYNWAKELPDIMNLYNNKYHRTIRDTPYNIFYKKHKNKQDILVVLNKFKIGDKVRIKLKKKIFDKGDLKTYSDDIYIILKKEGRKYLLSDNKYYSGRSLKLAKNIIKYIPENNEEEIIFKNNKKVRDLNKTLNKEGLNKSNIILDVDRNQKLYWIDE